MAQLDMTSFADGLKTLYSPEKIENLTYPNHPLLALLPKDENFGGKNKVIDVIYGNPQGRSAAFANAKSNQTAGKIKAFTITRNKDYQLVSIDNETIEASKGDANAFMEATTFEIDNGMAQLGMSLANAIYGSGTGKIGKIASINTLTITLSQVEDVVNFQVDQKLNFSTADGGGSVKSTKPLVTAVDRVLGKVTVDDATGLAGNDFIFTDGDYDGKLKGLAAWLPASVTNTPFFGMDRSVDPTRLAGIQFSAPGKPMEEAIIECASLVAREGGTPSHLFVPYSKYNELEKTISAKLLYTDLKVGEIGFQALKVNGPRGVITVIADQDCPADKGYMLQLNTWKLHSLGKAPTIQNLDGLKMLRNSDSDSVEIRMAYYAQLACRAPGYNAAITW